MYRITSANGSRSADQQQRAGRYLVSMGIRTLCVILCIVVPGPLRWVFAVGAIVLPYIAVVAANSVGERRRPAPAAPDGPPRPGCGPAAPIPYRAGASRTSRAARPTHAARARLPERGPGRRA